MLEDSALRTYLAGLDENPDDQLPLIEDESFPRLTLDWTFAAHGRRPFDYVGRDLLFGSLGRDYRAKVFGALRRSPPEWVRGQAVQAEIDGGNFQSFVNHLLLRCIHIRHLLQLSVLEKREPDRFRLDVLSALDGCRPVGLLFVSNCESHPAYPKPCWLNRACPWCHGRKVVKAYRRLIDGPCNPEAAGHKMLVMAKVRVDDAAPEGSDPESMTRARVIQVRKAWRPRLRRFAARLGMGGGLVAHQIGPRRLDDGRKSFRHDFSVLGEVDCGEGGLWVQARFDRLLRGAGADGARPGRPEIDDPEAPDHPVAVEVTGMRMADPMALRWLLAGSPAHRRFSDPGRRNIFRNAAAQTHDGATTVRKNLGVDGALALQPSFLFTAEQFWSHLGATRGIHLFSLFGNWGEVEVEPGQGLPVTGFQKPVLYP